jgi:hypothetical protein
VNRRNPIGLEGKKRYKQDTSKKKATRSGGSGGKIYLSLRLLANLGGGNE